jgi:hypothetical protein
LAVGCAGSSLDESFDGFYARESLAANENRFQLDASDTAQSPAVYGANVRTPWDALGGVCKLNWRFVLNVDHLRTLKQKSPRLLSWAHSRLSSQLFRWQSDSNILAVNCQ